MKVKRIGMRKGDGKEMGKRKQMRDRGGRRKLREN